MTVTNNGSRRFLFSRNFCYSSPLSWLYASFSSIKMAKKQMLLIVVDGKLLAWGVIHCQLSQASWRADIYSLIHSLLWFGHHIKPASTGIILALLLLSQGNNEYTVQDSPCWLELLHFLEPMRSITAGSLLCGMSSTVARGRGVKYGNRRRSIVAVPRVVPSCMLSWCGCLLLLKNQYQRIFSLMKSMIVYMMLRRRRLLILEWRRIC